jgi:hypothetical protein
MFALIATMELRKEMSFMINVNPGDLENYERDKKSLIVTQDKDDRDLYHVTNLNTLKKYQVRLVPRGMCLDDWIWVCTCPHFFKVLSRQNKACKHIIAVLKCLEDIKRNREKVEECKRVMELIEQGRCAIA